MYLSDKLTDEELDKLERRLKKVYSQAWDDLSETTNKYFEDFDRRWAVEYQKFLDGKAYKTNGKPDRKKFDAWVRTQIGRGERWAALRDHMGQAIGKTNVKAADMINGVLDGVYALNANYEAFRLEGYNDALDFTLYDRDTVRRLAEGKNAVEFRTKTVNPVRDYAWNKTQIENQLMTGILTGKSPRQIAGSFMQVMGRNQAAAIRNARTSVTSAQNAGRMDTYRRAKERGTDLQIEWISTWDSRTRTSHAKQDGERIDLDGTFSNGCRYPADPKGAPEEVYNCRCTTRAILPGINDEDRIIDADFLEWYENDKSGIRYNKKTDEYKNIKESVISNSITSNKPQKLTKWLTSERIWKKIGDVDKTNGSCASSALAYIGNKIGYDVYDFRGGKSREVFSSHEVIANIAKLEGVKSHIKYSKTGLTDAWDMVNMHLEAGKEYMLATGEHCAIIKKRESGLEYLELQRGKKNGWHRLNKQRLHCRFGVEDNGKNEETGEEYEFATVLIDIKTLKGNKEFIDILGYINSKR